MRPGRVPGHDEAMAGQKRTNPARRHALRAAAATVLAATAVPALAACGHGPSDATTTVRGAAGVTVVGPDGRAHPAVEGEHLLVGDTVETTTTASALLTGGRVTTLGPATTLDLAGRSHYVLAAGEVVVDHRHGPGADVVAGPVDVGDLGRTAVRIERGFAVRVAVYDGGSARVSAGEGSATVPALHEVDVPGASLPTAPAPLALRDDALDTAAAPALVAADRVLNGRAAALDRAGAAVPAALVRVLPAAPPATPLSLRLLPVAIARADPAAGSGQGGVGPVYVRARQLRTEGGSWGVVAALVGAPVAAVQQQLDALLTQPGTALTLPAVAAGSGGAAAVAAVLAAAAPPATGSAPRPAPAPAAPTTAPSVGVPVSVPTKGPVPPSPTPTPPVQSLLGTVLGLLPIGTPGPPSPSPAPGPGRSAPTPGGGLLGGVLGGLPGRG